MRPLTLLTVILGILCFFMVNMAFGEALETGKTITEDWFVNGDPGDKDYNSDDDNFDAMESESYLSGLEQNERKPTARPEPPKLKKSQENKAVKEIKKIYSADVEDPLG